MERDMESIWCLSVLQSGGVWKDYLSLAHEPLGDHWVFQMFWFVWACKNSTVSKFRNILILYPGLRISSTVFLFSRVDQHCNSKHSAEPIIVACKFTHGLVFSQMSSKSGLNLVWVMPLTLLQHTCMQKQNIKQKSCNVQNVFLIVFRILFVCQNVLIRLLLLICHKAEFLTMATELKAWVVLKTWKSLNLI